MKLLIARVASVLIVATMLVGAGAISALAAPQDDVLSLTNAQRSSAGVAPLARDTTLDAAAQQWANEMSRTQVFVHSSNDWRAARIPAGWTTHGENIAYGYTSASAVMTGWMASAGHRANILRSTFTHMGVGYVASGNYWVQIFAGYPVAPPVGSLDSVTFDISSGTPVLRVAGWVFDPATASISTAAHIYVTDPRGNRSGYAVTADGSRPDVGSAFPAAGPNHGFGWSGSITTPGLYQVCVYGIGRSVNTTLGCRSLNFGPGAPIGSFDTAAIDASTGTPTLSVSGWTFDSSLASASTQAHVYVTDPTGAVAGYAIPATSSRSDVAAAFPGAGANHGFGFTAPVTRQGNYTVCVYGIAVPMFGGNSLLGCRVVPFGPGSPLGNLDSAAINYATGSPVLSVSGWAFDNALRSAPTDVHIYVTEPSGAVSGYAVPASGSRPDVGSAFPGAGPSHGFGWTAPITSAGQYRVCVYAISAPIFGTNRLIKCQTVSHGPSAPIGAFDSAAMDSSGTNLSVFGWAFDGGARSLSNEVRVTVTDPAGASREIPILANGSRTDVGAAYSGAGPLHGFSATIPAPTTGAYRICVHSKSAPFFLRSFVALGCKQVVRVS